MDKNDYDNIFIEETDDEEPDPDEDVEYILQDDGTFEKVSKNDDDDGYMGLYPEQ